MRSGSVSSGLLGAVNPRIVDGLMAAGLAGAGCLVGSQYHALGFPAFDGRAYTLTILSSLPLAARRRYPVAVLVACCVAYGAYLYFGYQPNLNFWGPVVALVTAAAYRGRGTTLACAALTGGIVFYSGVKSGVLSTEICVVQAVLVPAIAVLFGSALRRQGERNRQLAARTARLHAEHSDRARRAVFEERVRIARELHDVIAHHMSVISVQAGLGRYVLETDPGTTRGALETISDTSREALAEMRRMLALLRVDPDDLDAEDGGADHVPDPAPGLDRLDALVERVRAAGVPVEVAVTGERRPLASGADLCVYRVIQEGLTNVLTHAGPARARVAIDYRRDGITATVTDDGQGPVVQSQANPSGRRRVGHGLAGMRERARLYGGTLSAGRRPEGGFEVVITLPATALQPTGTDRTGVQ